MTSESDRVTPDGAEGTTRTRPNTEGSVIRESYISAVP
ncbi:hypothetical protein SAMN05216403_10937 [Nitrosospira multiformis ATCC 25196]|uniref:Uncharacterized protein n=1 Tax=Nitrosospira multiformis (strain ATCC 25196 / NCIMB 11849 / C 71) TaxID=323848 RepID=A0A1H5UVT5_NITMU|nr:hypothetical protein SAMN05216403_10937 [Nitrosospira multiformis ATCC 25196]